MADCSGPAASAAPSPSCSDNGSVLDRNVHFHSLLLEGVYARGPNGALRFHPLPPPSRSPFPLRHLASRPSAPGGSRGPAILRRVFAVDVLECPRCGGRMRRLAAIQAPDASEPILDCLELPSWAPPAAPAVPDPEERADDFEATL